MKLSNPFAKTKKKTKAVTSRNGKSKKSKPKNKKVLAYFGLVAVLLLTTVSYGGIALYQREALKAEAGGWSYLRPRVRSRSEVRWVRACKTYSHSYYGGLYKVTVQAYRNNSNFTGFYGYAYEGSNRDKSYLKYTQNQWLYGVVAGKSFYTSANRGDTFTFYDKGTFGSQIYEHEGRLQIKPSRLANC